MKNDGELLGFGDFFSPDDVGSAAMYGPTEIGGYADDGGSEIGADPPRVKSTKTRKVSKPPTNRDTKGHNTVMRAGKAQLVKSINSTMKGVARVSRPPGVTTPAPGVKAKPPVARSAIKTAAAIKGKKVTLGADVKRKMNPKQQKAVEKHNKAVGLAKKARQVLAQHLVEQKKRNKVLAKGLVSQKRISKSLRTKGGRGSVGALFADDVMGEELRAAFNEYYDAVGQSPDANNPGFLTDGTPDPAYWGDYGEPLPEATDAELEATLSELSTDSNILDEGEAVDFAKLEKMPPDMFFSEQDRKDLGGLVYDESKGRPNGFAGSYGVFSRASDTTWGTKLPGRDDEHWGYVYGRFWDKGPEQGVEFGDRIPPNGWHRLHGGYVIMGSGDFWDNVSEGEVVAQNNPGGNLKNPIGVHTGPIIGNPALSDFKGMRMDSAGVFFWLPNEAPAWLTAKLKLAAAVTADAAKKAADEQKKLDEAQRAKDEADRQAQKAAQDAANALAESQAETEKQVALKQEEVAQAQQETQAQQALVQQQAQDTSQAQLDMEQQRQAGELMMQQAHMQQEMMQQQQQFLAERPELQEAVMVQELLSQGEEEPYVEEEEELSSNVMEDDLPIPGADVMQDSDGEGYAEEEVV